MRIRYRDTKRKIIVGVTLLGHDHYVLTLCIVDFLKGLVGVLISC